VFEPILSAGVLRVPERTDAALTAFDPRPRAVENWVKTLPRADVGETARRVYKGLHEMNRVRVPDNDRFRIAELLREPVNFLAMSLKKHYIGLPLPLPRKKQKIALLARELQAEMAIAYKIIIESHLSATDPRGDGKSLTIAIHRAIYYLSEVLLRCYQMYLPAPTNVWREIHGLYCYAVEKHLHYTVVKDQIGERHHNDTSINELYKQVVLMALAGPYRLRQSEIETLHGILVQWSPHTQINEITDPEQQTGMCSLNLVSDDPPGYLTLCSDANMSHCRVMDTVELINTVGAYVAQGTAVTAPGALGKANKLGVDLLRRLVLTWGGMAKRNFSRTAKNSQILVTLGIDSIHYFIRSGSTQDIEKRIDAIDRPAPTENAVPAAAPPATKTLDLLPIDSAVTHKPGGGTHFATRSRFAAKQVFTPSQPDLRKKDQWNPLFKLDTPQYEQGPDTAADGAIAAPDDEAHYDSYVCTAVNESAGGFCLVWMPIADTNAASLNALVGEIIGMQEIDEENKSRWTIGVIRWMKSRDGRQLELGVQKLAPYALAAGVTHDRGGQDFYRSLVLPEIRGASQPVTIIAPNFYDPDTMLTLAVEGERKSIRLVKLLETTGAFSHYSFKELRKPERARRAANDDDSKWNFDSIWTSL
jgi:hypothetical protein